MQGTRLARLAHQLQQEIALILQRELKDPRLGFVTITSAELSNDLSYLKVSYSCLGGSAECRRSQEVLEHSAGFIRSLIKKRFRLKVIPQVVFRYDESIVGAIEINETLDRIKHEERTQDSRPKI